MAMSGRDFLTVAVQLAAGTAEAEWRTAVSRAYYAAFHVARRLLRDLGFVVPRAERAHPYLIYRLCNCGEPVVQRAGQELESLRRQRNQADYDENVAVSQQAAADAVRLAQHALSTLDAARQEPTRTQITDAMKVYERDVLNDVTWHP